MIRGVGVDVVDLAAFSLQLADPASSFVSQTFTANERASGEVRTSGDPVRHLAARFAAKEAFIKAWSSSRWGSPPLLRSVDMREIEVIQDPWGRPSLRLHGDVARAAGRLDAHLSLSHDGGVAVAFVILGPETE